jgi:hypothetical protein
MTESTGLFLRYDFFVALLLDYGGRRRRVLPRVLLTVRATRRTFCPRFAGFSSRPIHEL